MSTIKTQVVNQYRSLRSMRRACIVEEIDKKQTDEEEIATKHLSPQIKELQDEVDRLNKEKAKNWSSYSDRINGVQLKKDDTERQLSSELDKLRRMQTEVDNNTYQQICELNSKLYKLADERRNIINKIKKIGSRCPDNQPKKLASFDKETEESILKYLNGDLKKLEA